MGTFRCKCNQFRSGKFSEHLLPISNPSQYNELITLLAFHSLNLSEELCSVIKYEIYCIYNFTYHITSLEYSLGRSLHQGLSLYGSDRNVHRTVSRKILYHQGTT